MLSGWPKLVSGAWLVTSVWVLLVRILDLTRLSTWEGGAREHLLRYPSDIAVAGFAVIVAVAASGALLGSRYAQVALKWCCWVIVAGAFALAISSLAVTSSRVSESLSGVSVLVLVGVAASLSIRALRHSEPGFV